MVLETDADELLVKQARQGDGTAFDILTRRYRRRVMRIVLRIIREPFDAEDAVQEIFIKAFRALDKFQGSALFSTWIYRIAINVANTHWQNNSKHMSTFTSSDYDQEIYGNLAHSIVDPNTPESILDGKQTATAIDSAMELLPLEMRTVLVLRQIDELSYEEIANIVGCPIGTVRSRIFRARQMIAHYLSAR
jgi:RNA polymerase sigma-70 factor (ECF subfamily)